MNDEFWNTALRWAFCFGDSVDSGGCLHRNSYESMNDTVQSIVVDCKLVVSQALL